MWYLAVHMHLVHIQDGLQDGLQDAADRRSCQTYLPLRYWAWNHASPLSSPPPEIHNYEGH